MSKSPSKIMEEKNFPDKVIDSVTEFTKELDLSEYKFTV